MVPILQDFWPETLAITTSPQWLLIFGYVTKLIKDRITKKFTICRSLCSVCLQCIYCSILLFWLILSVFLLSHYILLFFKLYFQRHHLMKHQFCRNISLNIWPSCKVWWNPPLLFIGCLDSCQPHCMPVTTTNRVCLEAVAIFVALVCWPELTHAPNVGFCEVNWNKSKWTD